MPLSRRVRPGPAARALARLLAVRQHAGRAHAVRAAPLVAVLAAGCASGTPVLAPPAGSGAGLGPGTTVFRGGSEPLTPTATGPLVGGGTSSLASYRGHVVVLNFWGSWCSACRQEAPALAAAAHRFQPSGVRFLGVDVADDTAGVRAYVGRFGIHFPSLSDPHEAITVGFRKVIPVADLPSTLVISRDGRIVARIIGAVTYQGLSRSIQIATGSAS